MNQANPTKTTVSRSMVAAISAACFAAALVLWLWWPDQSFWYGSFVRVGIVMAVFWYALPARGRDAAWARISPWALGGIALALILLPRMKHMIIPVLIVVVLAALFLRPRKRGRPLPASAVRQPRAELTQPQQPERSDVGHANTGSGCQGQQP
jgi:hypothetical protein